jgi:hypothetical protein
VAALLAVLGCGHATVPCPTPTSSIDAHRAEAERVGETIGRARAEERALRGKRDEAARRAAAAKAALDSLEAGGGAH